MASLKHLRRQRDKLTEERARLAAELLAAQAQLRELRDRVATFEAEVATAKIREAALQEEARQARTAEHTQRQRAIEAEGTNAKLEESLAQREAEVARLREALEEQRLLTKEVCEAAERRADGGSRRHEERARQLEAEKEAMQQDLQDKAKQIEDMRRALAAAVATAEKAMAMHALSAEHLEKLRAAKLSEAINHKVELHISVPRVTLSYNNAPPLLVSAAVALSEGRIREFLESEVFPHFRPLWVRMDDLDKAPDGSSKRAYSTKMLDRLTEAVKCFVLKSQQADESASLEAGGARAAAETGLPGAAAARLGAGPQPGRRGGQGGSLGESDRARLLELLRSGDDRGLDSKLVELLGSGGP